MSKTIEDHWYCTRQALGDPDGKTIAMDSFLLEEKDFVSIVVREIIQNVLDARKIDAASGKRKTATLKINIVDHKDGLSTDTLLDYTSQLEGHLEAANHELNYKSKDFCGALVIEEFETTGLTGTVDNSRFSDEPDYQRWNNFWHGEAKEIKAGRSLGRRGQGKITYHLASGTSTVLALSNQQDGESNLLFGKCIFRETHELDGKYYNRHAFWCAEKDASGDIQPVPIDNTETLKKFKNDFKISRGHEDGTSWVIPFIRLSEFTSDRILKEIIKEFFIAILHGDIVCDVCGTRVDASNLEDTMMSLEVFSGERLEYVKWLISGLAIKPNQIELNSSWYAGSEMPASEDALDDEDLEICKKLFEDGDTITFKVPIPITRSGKAKIESAVTAFLAYKPDAESTHELYSRDSLMIEEERWLKPVPGKFFGALIALEDEIVDFLGCAEEASHLKWNPQLTDLQKKYDDRTTTLSMVRRSLPALARLLLEQESRIYDDIFNDLMTVPGAAAEKKAKKKRKRSKTGIRTGRPGSQPLLSVDQTGGILMVSAGPGFSKVSCPEVISFALAYKTLEGTGDSFREYHHFDFDLSDSKQHPFEVKKCSVVSADLNQVELNVEDPDFTLRVPGFSEHSIALQVRRT